MGSKSRIAKHIVPIIQAEIDKGATCYIEPFVGGANVIDKIKCETKIGYDSNEYLIALLNHVRDGGELPEEITRDTYAAIRSNPGAHEKWLVGAAGFLASYNGRFFDGGYARSGYEKNGRKRDYYAESKKNIMLQAKNIGDIEFISCDYNAIPAPPEATVVYCDPPYAKTKPYKVKFDTEAFWDWVREWSKSYTVLVSEETAPDDFECIWEQNVFRTINAPDKHISTEKLFKLKEKTE